MPLFSAETVADDSDLAQKEWADSLVSACRQVLNQPSSQVDVAAMLDEAAKTFERLGDRKALQDCRNVMTKISKSASTTSTPGGSMSVL